MFINLQTKIWLTILTIVLLFSFFTLYYFPDRQGKAILESYKNEMQNYAETVSLGVKIALSEQNYEGVTTAVQYALSAPGCKFVRVVKIDSIWNRDSSGFKTREDLILEDYPKEFRSDSGFSSKDSLIVKRAPFKTAQVSGDIMSGNIILGFTSDAINEGKRKIRRTSLIVSGCIFVIGMLIGFWLSRSISRPVRVLRDAAHRVGKGDLTLLDQKFPRDEIGELSIAFNDMIGDISKAKDLQNKNVALSESNRLLNETLADLKATQTQLIQAEKMASLGELTAGIAHEIQNPLNFVNNFSDLNTELIDEMKEAIKTGDTQTAMEIADDIRNNEEKISHHGKRADGIVKGMLQHSRSSSGKKEPNDINALAEEYLRLAYHGLRAKDKTFNATMKTDFDKEIGSVDVIPQDFGRVILNLVTNAFYAVAEKKKQQPGEYEPTVYLSTKKVGKNVEIRVRDNGNGIPEKVLEKIFQPFFTTKPTGKGTGLGLSLSYDIVKTHGGELKVETKEGEGSEFIVALPI